LNAKIGLEEEDEKEDNIEGNKSIKNEEFISK